MNDQTGDAPIGPAPGGGEGPRTAEGLTDWSIPVVPSLPVKQEDWAWAHERRPEPPTRVSPEQVAAVLIVHQAGEWLGPALARLAGLADRPGVTIAVDMGSEDESADLLASAQRDGLIEDVLHTPGDRTPGEGVASAVAILPDGITHLWILHDDLELTPDSLHQMLVEVSRAPMADVAFPTLLRPAMRNYPEFIEEQGQTLSTTGARVLPVVDRGDIDQHQGEPVRVLGGSTAGMFISLKAWRRVGGFDPAVPLFRDGVEFGWRANEAGLVVRTAPSCAIHHRQAGRGWERDSVLAERPDLTDRLVGMRMVAARSESVTRTSLALMLQCLVRALVLLLGKAPGRAADELRAGTRLWRTRSQTAAMAERISTFRQSCDPDDVAHTARLLPTHRRMWRRVADQFAGDVSDRLHPGRDSDLGTSIDELTADDDFAGREHHTVLNPYNVMVVGMLLLGVVAGRSLLGSGSAVSSWLAPAPGGLSGAWSAWLTAVPGQLGGSSPWLGVAALGSVITVGQPEVFARACLLLAPLAAAMSAHRLTRRVLGLGVPAVLVASMWALLPVITGSLARGSITGLTMAVVTPQVALHSWRLLAPATIDVDELWGAGTSGASDRWRSAGAAAAWTAIAISLVPASWVMVLIVMVAALRADRTVWRQVLLVLIAPLVVVSPWLVRIASAPARLITGADPLLTGTFAPRAGLWVLLGGGVSVAAVPAWVSLVGVLPLWFAALWALTWLLRHRGAEGAAGRGRVIGTAAVSLLAFLAAGIAARRLVPLWGTEIHPEIETWQMVGLGGLLALVATAWQGTLLAVQADDEAAEDQESDPDRAPSLGELMARWSSKVLPGVLTVGLVASCLWWVAGGAGQPLHRVSSKLPAYVTAVQDSPRRTRTLMILVQGGGTSWNLVDSRNPGWGTGEKPVISTDPRIRADASELARAVATGDVGEDLAARLKAMGVAHVWLRGAADDVVSQVSNASGLTSARADADTTVWSLDGDPSRAWLVSGRSVTQLSGTVPSGSGDRRLVIAEPRDDRWRVSVGGVELERLDAEPSGGIGQTYRLGSASGPVTWSMPNQGWVVLVEVGAMLILMIVAGPNASRRAPAPRRSMEADK